ncbi:MAG: HD domain-containing protein [Clostridiales bacterium]|nr:HD domain-containing protein [Clostridiales bacterium]
MHNNLSLTLGIPTRQAAEEILQEAETHNIGLWGKHSRNVAICAEKIAVVCGMDGDKAYVLGLLHDIGRKFGVRHLGHVYDGYKYMLELGYTQVAKICLTHSFCIRDLSVYIGEFDITDVELQELKVALNSAEYDDYDRLIQLCDALGAANGIVDIEQRMQDVKNRYGFYPQNKWDKNIELKLYFENIAKQNIYEIVGEL